MKSPCYTTKSYFINCISEQNHRQIHYLAGNHAGSHFKQQNFSTSASSLFLEWLKQRSLFSFKKRIHSREKVDDKKVAEFIEGINLTDQVARLAEARVPPLCLDTRFYKYKTNDNFFPAVPPAFSGILLGGRLPTQGYKMKGSQVQGQENSPGALLGRESPGCLIPVQCCYTRTGDCWEGASPTMLLGRSLMCKYQVAFRASRSLPSFSCMNFLCLFSHSHTRAYVCLPA